MINTANYDVIIVESVGLGQSEVDIDMAVDMLIVIVPPGGGDGLQASKKGIMEAADLIVVNKADGDLLVSAKHTKADYAGAMHFVRQKHLDWRTPVLMMSARTGLGLAEVEDNIREFHRIMSTNGNLRYKRSSQLMHWMKGHLRRQIIDHVEKNPKISNEVASYSLDVANGRVTPRSAASAILAKYIEK